MPHSGSFHLYNPPRRWQIILSGQIDEVDAASQAIEQNQREVFQNKSLTVAEDNLATVTIELKLIDPTMITLVRDILSTDFQAVTIIKNGELHPDE